ncbi:uncharacterized protein VNE69_04113 [Vairimorpha necatrix]|uniref:Uncharacterized protein n=1 Tax=Vairimorpha necatrix TaxID=6039 RepID=A0AAX4JBM6_9MICR
MLIFISLSLIVIKADYLKKMFNSIFTDKKENREENLLNFCDVIHNKSIVCIRYFIIPNIEDIESEYKKLYKERYNEISQKLKEMYKIFTNACLIILRSFNDKEHDSLYNTIDEQKLFKQKIDDTIKDYKKEVFVLKDAIQREINYHRYSYKKKYNKTWDDTAKNK